MFLYIMFIIYFKIVERINIENVYFVMQLEIILILKQTAREVGIHIFH